MFRAKGIHLKSRLDECRKFDEECKYRAIADKMMKEVFRLNGIPKLTIIKTQNVGITCKLEKIIPAGW